MGGSGVEPETAAGADPLVGLGELKTAVKEPLRKRLAPLWCAAGPARTLTFALILTRTPHPKQAVR